MAWWTTQLIFHNDVLIAEGIDPAPLDDLEVVVNGHEPPAGGEAYTRVIVSGYALYGKLHGYYALGVSHYYVDRPGGRAYMSENSQRHIEPVASLTPAQRTIVRECLIHISPLAWENSNLSFRQQLET
jgi:hypothetical protein